MGLSMDGPAAYLQALCGVHDSDAWIRYNPSSTCLDHGREDARAVTCGYHATTASPIKREHASSNRLLPYL
jgi:hypothetical protein